MNPFLKRRLTGLAFGLVLVVAGLLILGPPLIDRVASIGQTNQRGNADTQAQAAWKSGGDRALIGAAQDATAGGPATCNPGGNSSGQFALVQFTGITNYAYTGVAGDGTWDMLHTRSMVHYTGTPGPGQKGNVIIAFHREPNYEHIDELGAGGTVTIQDRACHQYVYTVDQRWNLSPDKVTQLTPTGGYDLTLITCTPFWQDYNRFVWRAHLTSVDGVPFTPPAS